MTSPYFFFIAVLLLLRVTPSWAQQDRRTTYFPLQVGNSWTYYTILEPPDRPPVTVIFDPVTIQEKVVIDEQGYFLYELPFLAVDTIRTDGEGRIYQRYKAEDRLLFDFTLPDSASFLYGEYVVTIQHFITQEFAAGRFENCIRFRFDIPEAVDDERSYTFAPGIGLISATDGMGDGIRLYRAEIGGQPITSTEQLDAPTEDAPIAVYPNPFNTSVMIEFALEQPTYGKLEIYDVLARRVATLIDGTLQANRYLVGWDGDGQPAGVYFARLQVGSRTRTQTLILAK